MGRKKTVSLGEKSPREETGIWGKKRQVTLIYEGPLVFGFKPPPALFTGRGKMEKIFIFLKII